MISINWRSIFVAVIICVLVMLLGFMFWYYTHIYPLLEFAKENRARIQAVEELTREKHCKGEPYKSEAVRQFCEGKTLQQELAE